MLLDVSGNPVIYRASGISGLAIPDIYKAGVHVWTLSGNVTIGQPRNPPAPFTDFILQLIQGNAGSYSVTWASCFRDAPSWSAGALGTYATAVFRYDGQVYQYIGGSSAFAGANDGIVPQTGSLGISGGQPQVAGALVAITPAAGGLTFAGNAATRTP